MGWFSVPEKILCRLRGGILRFLITLRGGRCGRGLRVEAGLRLRQGIHSGLQIGADVYVGRDTTIDCVPGAKLEIGDNATLTQGNFISSVTSVVIDRDTMIGEYTSIRDANHSFADVTVPMAAQPMAGNPVAIGRDVWIGRGCAILGGTRIGDGAIVGANSVVTRDLPDYAIAIGAPARVVSSRTSKTT